MIFGAILGSFAGLYRGKADARTEPARYDRKISATIGENIIEPDIAPADRFGSTHAGPAGGEASA
jgi:hypothetical protein